MFLPDEFVKENYIFSTKQTSMAFNFLKYT